MSLDDRADALDEKLKDNSIDKSVEILVNDAKKRNRQILILAISLILDVVLTVGFAILSIQAQKTAAATRSNREAVVTSCKTGNEFRKTEGQLWEHILSIQPVFNNLTPEQQTQRDQTVANFKKYLATTFAPRDCNKIIEDQRYNKVMETMLFMRGDDNDGYTLSVLATNWTAGGRLFFAAKQVVDDDNTDAAALIQQNWGDDVVTDVTIGGFAYKQYACHFPSSATNSIVSDGAETLDLFGEFQYVPSGGDPISIPGPDSERIPVTVRFDIKRKTTV